MRRGKKEKTGKSHSASYAAAGVNIEAGYEGVRLMKKHVARTMIPGVVSDLAGFAVGIVDKSKVIDQNKMSVGDVVLALPSSGCHSNGYSLVRKVFDVENTDLNQYYEELGTTLGEALLTPTVIYVKPVLAAIEAAEVHGVSHITGGGFYENIPRCIPDGLCAKISKKDIKVPAIFNLLQREATMDLLKNRDGQIATQYVDLNGVPTMDVDFNPNGSVWAVEGITSPDGRVLGKMGHSERIGKDLYRNVPGEYQLHLFEAAKAYYNL